MLQIPSFISYGQLLDQFFVVVVAAAAGVVVVVVVVVVVYKGL